VGDHALGFGSYGSTIPTLLSLRRRNVTMPQITRRDFVKLGAVSAGALGTTPLGFDLAEAVQVQQNLRIDGAKEVHSLCPYCAVGCSIIAFTKEDAKGHAKLLQIEGDPDSPVNEGRLCPKGATAMQLAISSRR